MIRNKLVTFLILILLLPLPLQSQFNVMPQDGFVQIVSINVEKSQLQIGERLHVNLTYDLIYDLHDPLAIGAITITITPIDGTTPVFLQEFTEMGINVNKTVLVDILPFDWSPKTEGQIGKIRVVGWIQDSHGSMIDSVENNIIILQGQVLILADKLPSNVYFHDVFNITGILLNVHNSSIPLANHLVEIIIRQKTKQCQVWFQNSTLQGEFLQVINTLDIGTGDFLCNITSYPNEDYTSSSIQIPFQVSEANLDLDTAINASVFHTYYPSLPNCYAHITATINCESNTHDMKFANVTWTLDNHTGFLNYEPPNSFSADVAMPTIPGNYNIVISAKLPNHQSANNSLPVSVVSRNIILKVNSNRTTAAYGDVVKISINAQDQGFLLPVRNKTCLIFLLNQSHWDFLAQLILNEAGCADFIWSAHEIDGEDEFTFKVIFQGDPEFTETEASLIIVNTRETRIVFPPNIDCIRGHLANCTIRLTNLDSLPLNNISINFIKSSTGETWSSAFTNSSGYAYLVWQIPQNNDLGIHMFNILAKNGQDTLFIIPITLSIYEATILELPGS